MNRKNSAFTLIELLVVVLILGILVAVALPSYLSSVKDSRHKTANANAIATAVQALYVKSNGAAYNHSSISDAAIIAELGGTVPVNPCTGAGALSTDYSLTLMQSSAAIRPAAGTNCDSDAMPNISLSQ